MIWDFFAISLNNIKRRKLRSWLTMLGIFIGIAAVVSLISLGQGLQNAVTGQFESLSTDKLTIQNAGTGLGPPGSTVIDKLNNHDLRIIEGVKGVEVAGSRLVRIAKIEYNDNINFNYIVDIPREQETMNLFYDSMNLKAQEGRLLKSSDHGKVVLGRDVAKETTFDKKIEVGKRIMIQEKSFEVIGVLKKGSNIQVNSMVTLLNEDLEDLLDINDEIDIIIVQIAKNEDIEEVAKRIEKVLRNDRGLKEGEEDFSVQTPLQSLSTVNQILGVIQGIVVGIAAISLIVGGIGVANTMYTSVLERKKEIGTMKSIGAKNSDILSIFLIESGLLGLVGGIIGVLIGAGLAIGLSSIANNFFGNQIIDVNLSWPLMISVLVFSFLLGILFGAIPSYQASKLKPVDALRG